MAKHGFQELVQHCSLLELQNALILCMAKLGFQISFVVKFGFWELVQQHFCSLP